MWSGFNPQSRDFMPEGSTVKTNVSSMVVGSLRIGAKFQGLLEHPHSESAVTLS